MRVSDKDDSRMEVISDVDRLDLALLSLVTSSIASYSVNPAAGPDQMKKVARQMWNGPVSWNGIEDHTNKRRLR